MGLETCQRIHNLSYNTITPRSLGRKTTWSVACWLFFPTPCLLFRIFCVVYRLLGNNIIIMTLSKRLLLQTQWLNRKNYIMYSPRCIRSNNNQGKKSRLKEKQRYIPVAMERYEARQMIGRDKQFRRWRSMSLSGIDSNSQLNLALLKLSEVRR